MPSRNESTPFFAQVSFVPPAEHDWFIEPVRSMTSMMCAGFGLPPPIEAVDLALSENELIPKTFAKIVLTLAVCVTTMAFGFVFTSHQAGTEPLIVMHFP